MNKVILIGKLIDVKRTGNSHLHTIGISGSSDYVEVYSKFDKSEFKGYYIEAIGFVSERSGRTAILINSIKKITLSFKDEAI